MVNSRSGIGELWTLEISGKGGGVIQPRCDRSSSLPDEGRVAAFQFGAGPLRQAERDLHRGQVFPDLGDEFHVMRRTINVGKDDTATPTALDYRVRETRCA